MNKPHRDKSIQRLQWSGFLAVVLALLGGCKQTGMQVPSVVAPLDKAVVWHDLLSPDSASSRKFMSNALGWSVAVNEPYSAIRDQKGNLVGGMIDTQDMGWGLKSGGWLLSMQTQDLDAALNRVTQLGGKILQPARPYPDRGRSAVVEDPQGAVFELVQLEHSADAEPVSEKVWIWHELITGDPAATATWYGQVFQLSVSKMDGDRRMLTKGDVKIATVSKNPFSDARNQWIPVVAVADFEAVLPKVTQWGGRVAVAPSPKIASGTLALIQDPTGAALLLQTQE